MILIRETFRCRGVYTQLPLHRDAFTQVLWHANTSTQCFYGRILLRRNSSAHIACKHFYIETFWHTVAGAFTCKYFYTGVFILRAFSLHTHMLCHRDAFDHTCFYTEIFLHGDTFAQRETPFYPQILLQRDDFTVSNLHRNQNKQRCFYKGMHVHEGFLTAGIFTQTYYWIISCGGHAYGAKSSASICKITVSPQLLMVETHFVGKGWPRANPHCNLASCMTIDISCERVAFRGHQSTLPCRSKRKVRNNQGCRCL